MQRNRAEVDEVDQRLDIVAHEILDVALRVLAPDRNRLDPLRHEAGRVFLIEGLAVNAVGIPGEHDGAVLEIRQQPGRHRPVVLDEVALGVLLVGPKHFVEVGELHLSWERGDGRCTVRRLQRVPLPSPISLLSRHHHIFRFLVIPKAHKDRLPQQAIRRELLVPYVAHELWLNPGVVWAFGERAVLGRLARWRRSHQRRELSTDLGDLVTTEPRSGPATVDQRAVFVRADVERAEAATGALGFREPDDQKVVHAVGANLEPVAGAAVSIRAVRLLGNDAFEPQSHDLLVQRLPVLLEVLRKAQRAGLRQHLAQDLFTLDERQLAQIVALEGEHIEHVQRGG